MGTHELALSSSTWTGSSSRSRSGGIPVENVYSDKLSDKDFDRPMYKALLAKLKNGCRCADTHSQW
ncbi:hypothetical protein AGMMS49992_12700 [Clostridia bacterium]|nr:hypothetical protein AGMMS49992_12700 [Clostridia bacterium]